jgi:hypothetical protein
VRLTNADFLRYGVPCIHFYRILADAEMGFLLVLFWCLAALSNSCNSRFGQKNFRVGAATGIYSQGVDYAYCFRGRTEPEPGKSKKFPVIREFG